MADFSATHVKSSNVVGHLLALVSNGSVKPKLFEIVIGTSITPTDNAGEYRIIRTNASSTGPQTVTEVSLDPDGTAIRVVAEGGTMTTDATETGGALLVIPLNMRATFRWVTNTKFIQGVNTADNGLALDVVAQSSAFLTHATMMWEE